MLLASKIGLKLSSSREYSDDFVGDLNLVHRSELYIQLGNGGMFAAAVNSKASYFLGGNVFPYAKQGQVKKTVTLSNGSKAFGVNISKGRVNPWQSELQVLHKQSLKDYPRVVVNWDELADLVGKLNFD